YHSNKKFDFETKQVDGTRPNVANVSNWDEAIWDQHTFDRIEMYMNRLIPIGNIRNIRSCTIYLLGFKI
ncbi:hypothetical protein ACT453_46470, partial [Bacillus sp. D-CC]